MTTYNNNTLALSRAIGLDPQILHEFAENISRQMEAQAAAFAPALQAIQSAPASQAFYPGGLDSYDPERAKRPPLPQDKMPNGGILGGMGGMLEDMNQKIDGFLQFFKDLAAATAEALNNLYEFGDAIKALAELAATAAESVSALLQMQPKPEEAPQESKELAARQDRFKGLYKAVPPTHSLSQGQRQTPPAQQPLLGGAAQGIQLLIDKFEPILQGIHGLVQQCFTALVLIEMNLITLPAMMPKPEEKGLLGKLSDLILEIIPVIFGGLIGKALKLAVAIIWSIIVVIVSFLLEAADKALNSALHSALSDLNNNPKSENGIAYTPNSIIEYTSQSDQRPKLNSFKESKLNQTFAWPGIVPLSVAAPTPPNTVTNTNYYSNCNNNNNNPDLTIHALMQATTPDALAERIGRELKTLGMAFNYAVQG